MCVPLSVSDAERILQARKQQRTNNNITQMTDVYENTEDLEEDFPEIELNELIDEIENMQLEDSTPLNVSQQKPSTTTNVFQQHDPSTLLTPNMK
jgi:hypothetical protein